MGREPMLHEDFITKKYSVMVRPHDENTLRAGELVHEDTAHEVIHRVSHAFDYERAVRVGRKHLLFILHLTQCRKEEYPSL